MSNSKDSVKLELTPEQKAMIKNTTGKNADAVEFSVTELEERIAPGTLFPGPGMRGAFFGAFWPFSPPRPGSGCSGTGAGLFRIPGPAVA